MTLPEKSEKEYLEITKAGAHLLIVGNPRHIAELKGLLLQRGVPCASLGVGAPRLEALELQPDADRDAAQEVLYAYKAAKGS